MTVVGEVSPHRSGRADGDVVLLCRAMQRLPRFVVEDPWTGHNQWPLRALDHGFFRVRLDRLTPRERDYLRAMAELGPGPHRSGDIASVLGVDVRSVGPLRGGLIRKGMVYSPQHGDTAFGQRCLTGCNCLATRLFRRNDHLAIDAAAPEHVVEIDLLDRFETKVLPSLPQDWDRAEIRQGRG